MLPVSDFTVGNSVTIAVAIYRHNLRKFLWLSFIAHLWLLVPIYGWVRYFAIAAWMSRLSLRKLSDRSDNVEREQYFTIGALFLFLSTALITIFITVILGYVLIVLCFTAVVVFLQTLLNSPILDTLSNIVNRQEGIAFWLISCTFILLFSLVSTLLYIRLFLSDFGFISKQNHKMFGLIKYSCLITKNNKLKVFKILWISFISSFSLYVSVYIFFVLISFILNSLDLYQFDLLYYGVISIYLLTFIILNVILFPFWQSVKATAFYQIADLEKNYNLRQ